MQDQDIEKQNITDLILEKATRVASRVFLKLPSTYRTIYSREDILQDLLLKFVQVLPKYDSTKINGNIDAFIGIVLKKQAITICTNIWDQKEKDTMIEECEAETNKEKSMAQQTEDDDEDFMEKTLILANEIRRLCRKFKIKYHEERELVSLRNILNYALNEMSDEAFNKLSRPLQITLAKYGESFRRGGIDISQQSKNILGSGITNVIKKLFAQGFTTPKEIIKKLDATGVIYRKDTVLTLIYRERTRKGLGTLTKKQTGVSKVIGDFYDNGAGITNTKEMFDKLRTLGYKCIPSTVNKIMRRIRIERGLPPHQRPPNTLTIKNFQQ